MGKRKSKSKVMKKVKLTVAKVFDCPFCNHAGSVEAKLNKKLTVMMGEVSCRVCGISYKSQIHILSDPVDVYSEWIDKCEEETAKAHQQLGSGDADDEQGLPKRRKEDRSGSEMKEEAGAAVGAGASRHNQQKEARLDAAARKAVSEMTKAEQDRLLESDGEDDNYVDL